MKLNLLDLNPTELKEYVMNKKNKQSCVIWTAYFHVVSQLMMRQVLMKASSTLAILALEMAGNVDEGTVEYIEADFMKHAADMVEKL